MITSQKNLHTHFILDSPNQPVLVHHFSTGFDGYSWILFLPLDCLSRVSDQQQKQAIPFQRGIILQELGDRVLVCSSNDVYALVPVPWQKQASYPACIDAFIVIQLLTVLLKCVY